MSKREKETQKERERESGRKEREREIFCEVFFLPNIERDSFPFQYGRENKERQ